MRTGFVPYIPKHRRKAADDISDTGTVQNSVLIEAPPRQAVSLMKSESTHDITIGRRIEIGNNAACTAEDPSQKRKNGESKILPYIPVHRRKVDNDAATDALPQKRKQLNDGILLSTSTKRTKHHAAATSQQNSSSDNKIPVQKRAIRQLIDKVTAEDSHNAVATATAAKRDEKLVIHEACTTSARRMICNSLGITVKKTTAS